MEQLNLFAEDCESVKQTIIQKLWSYGVDEYFKNNLDSNRNTYQLRNQLISRDPEKYDAYYKALIDELKKVLPQDELKEDTSNMFGDPAIVHHIVNGRDAYNLRSYGMWSPILLASLIDARVFEK